MTNHKYLLKMTPLNTYFFGGEKTFTTVDGETNYFARSNQWPQQTTVLGMLRYLIGNTCSYDPNKIGKHSFIAGSNDGFGIIEKLSPVFLVKVTESGKDNYLLEGGIDHQWNEKTGRIERTVLNEPETIEDSKYGVYNSGYSGTKNIPNLKFDNKDFLVQVLCNYCTDELIDPSSLFHEQFQVGNKKNYKGGVDDEAFFKQIFYRLEKKHAFAVILETKEELNLVEIDTIGADQSLFKIEAKSLKGNVSVFDEIETTNQTITDAKRIVLLSDAYIDANVLAKCNFSICDTTDFRNIVTHTADNSIATKTVNFIQMDSKRINSAYKTKVKYNLMRRGSVLFTDDATGLLKEMNEPTFHTIGYNYYQLTK